MPAAPGSVRFSRLVTMVVLIFAVCGFGAVTLCGGVVTVLSFGASDYGGAFWIISVPTLLIGACLCFLCAHQLRKVWRQLDRPDEP